LKLVSEAGQDERGAVTYAITAKGKKVAGKAEVNADK
jgi:hypothetical protein